MVFAIIQLSCATQNSPSKDDSSIYDLMKRNQSVYMENQTIDDGIDFTSISNAHPISEGISQIKIQSGITFKNCVFNKSVLAFKKLENGNMILTAFLGNVSFIDCIFKEEVNFRGSSIYGRVDFTGSTFNSDANFEDFNCHENAFYNQCTFEGTSRFQNAYFNQNANFMNAEFYGITSFQSSLFNSELQFSAIKCVKYADFTLIDCRGKTFFNYAEFKEKADFSHAIFNQDFQFVSTVSQNTRFDACRFLGDTRFNETEMSSLTFSESYFLFQSLEVLDANRKLTQRK